MEYKKYLRPRYVYLLSTIYCVVLLLVYQVQLSDDSQSYISAWESFRNGSIDMWRTPVYPFFLGFLNIIFGDVYYLLIAVIIQHVVFLISIRYFYLLLKIVIKNDMITLIVTAIYALCPCVQTYNCFVQTETFAVVGTIFFLYSSFMLCKYTSFLYGIGSSFWLFFLVFLRPSSIYLIPIMLVFWLWIIIKERKYAVRSLWIGLGGSVIVGIVLAFYVFSFKTYYGLLSPCGIGVINKYCIARQACIIEPMVSCDVYYESNFKGCVFDHSVVGTIPDVFYEAECAISEFGLKEFSDYVSTAIKHNTYSYIKRIVINVQRSSADRLFGVAFPEGKLMEVLTLNLNFFYVLFLLYIIVLVKWIKERKLVPFSFLLCIIGLSHMFVVFAGSPNNYDRLALQVFPVFLIMIGQLLQLIKISRSSDVDFV